MVGYDLRLWIFLLVSLVGYDVRLWIFLLVSLVDYCLRLWILAVSVTGRLLSAIVDISWHLS